MNNDFSRIFDQATPEAPDTHAWGPTVRRGHRRHQIAVAAVAAVVALGIAVPVVWQAAATNEPNIVATPAPSPSATATDSSEDTPAPSQSTSPSQAPGGGAITTRIDERCADAVGTMTELPDGLLPLGPSRILLCDGDQEPLVRAFGPAEPLTEGVDEVVDEFNNRPSIQLDDTECMVTPVHPRYYTVVVEYPDGTSHVLTGSTDGCNAVEYSNGARAEAGAFLDSLIEHWESQRQQISYPLDLPAVCPDADSMMGPAIDSLVTGHACGFDPDATDRSDPIARELSPELVERFLAGATEFGEPLPSTEPQPYVQSLVLENEFGDPVTFMRWLPDQIHWMWRGPDGQWMMWEPDQAMNAELDAVFEGLKAEDFPQAPPETQLCGGSADSGPLSSVADVEFGALCQEQEDRTTLGTEIPADRLAAIVDGFEREGQAIEDYANEDLSGAYLELADGLGAQGVFVILKDRTIVWIHPDQGLIGWHPDEATAQWLVEQGVTG